MVRKGGVIEEEFLPETRKQAEESKKRLASSLHGEKPPLRPQDVPISMGEEEEANNIRVASVREKYEETILKYPNVMGITTGFKSIRNKLTRELCLVILVEKKVGEETLAKEEIIPKEIDGVQTDVVEIGRVKILDS
ncbi:MAG: hypothetical protein JSU77_03690 [Fidelibacterota bacterium]|nr:MAG: hypothetical protein JSU77_03690 [Candidatus Neomarinimicrobiota bacterium]